MGHSKNQNQPFAQNPNLRPMHAVALLWQCISKLVCSTPGEIPLITKRSSPGARFLLEFLKAFKKRFEISDRLSASSIILMENKPLANSRQEA
jgi:hypothetical protein